MLPGNTNSAQRQADDVKADTNWKCTIYSLKKIYNNCVALNKLIGVRQGYKLLGSEFKQEEICS